MSASERDREAAWLVHQECVEHGYERATLVMFVAEALATARAEARRAAFSEAAEVAANVAEQYGTGSPPWAACRILSDRLRAKAGEEQR